MLVFWAAHMVDRRGIVGLGKFYRDGHQHIRIGLAVPPMTKPRRGFLVTTHDETIYHALEAERVA